MASEISRTGLYSIGHEIAALQNRAMDKSEAGSPLRSVKRHIAVGDSLLVANEGYSCDVTLSIPQPLLDATSRFTYSKALSDYANRATRNFENKRGYVIVQKMNKFFAELGSYAPRLPDGRRNAQHEKAISTLRDLVHSCNDAHRFFTDFQKEIDQNIEAELSTLEGQVKSLNEQHASMKNSSKSSRALQTSSYYDGLLNLAKIVGVSVPLSGIEEGSLLGEVNIKIAEGDSINIIGASNLKSVFGSTLKDENLSKEGRLAALKHLSSHVIPEQYKLLEGILSKIKQLVPSLALDEAISKKEGHILGKVRDDVPLSNISEDQKQELIGSANEALNKIAKMNKSFVSTEVRLLEKLKIEQSERADLVKLNNLEYAVASGELALAKDLVGRLSEVSHGFDKSVARMGFGKF